MKIVSVGYLQQTVATFKVDKSDDFKVEETIHMPKVIWPQKCACCGGESANSHYHLEHAARSQEFDNGETVTKSSYPLEWQVPYCPICAKHSETSLAIFLNIFFILLS